MTIMGMTYRQVCIKNHKIMTFISVSTKSYPYQDLQLNKNYHHQNKQTKPNTKPKSSHQPKKKKNPLNKITYDHNTNIHRKKEINTWYYPATLKFTGNKSESWEQINVSPYSILR